MYDFAYQKPGSLADAVKVLSGDMDAKALAGGMTDAVPVGPGTAVRVHFSHLGSLVVHRGK